MSLYLWSLAAGGLGLLAMAVSGLGRHGHGGGLRHAGGRAARVPSHHGAAPRGISPHSASHHGLTSRAARSSRLWWVVSPRGMFSVMVGAGATGMLLRAVLVEPFVLVTALAGGLAFERLLISPIWNFLLRFASEPALTLESVIADEARAVSGFDAAGQGLIAVELDGQVVQVLGTLRPEDQVAGVQVRAGDRLRIEDVDSRRNRCTVSYLE
jgi:hypothetical protein